MPILDELKDRLVAQGVGVFGTNIFLGSNAAIPIGEGPYLLLRETGGSEPVRTHGTVQVERPGVSLVSRAKTTPPARSMLKAAWDALGGAKGLHNVTLGSTFYQNIVPRQSITDIGKDDDGRVMFSFNLGVDKNP